MQDFGHDVGYLYSAAWGKKVLLFKKYGRA